LASKRFHLAKSVFHGLRFVWQNQVSKIGYIFSGKVLASLVRALFARFVFSGKVNFSQSQFSAKVSASSRLCVLANQFRFQWQSRACKK